jgi:lysophospholipase L1-like esterase
VVLINVGPSAAYAGFSTINGDQESIESYNHWLRGFALSQGFGFVDMYKALGAPTNAPVIDNKYNSGDNLHPNADGGALIARLVTQQLFSLLR